MIVHIIITSIVLVYAILETLRKDSFIKITSNGFIQDDPIDGINEEDQFGRKDYAKHLTSLIEETNNKRSFNIAINGAWGSGKTSFLNLMAKEMKNKPDKFITVNYNPWDFKEEKIIGLDLLKAINLELADEVEVKTLFKGLMTSLQSSNKSTWNKVIPFLINGFSDEKSLNYYRQRIGQVLGKENKKLIIFLDDLDRLNGEEIIEVFKTIRNSFNIANTFFILGFDYQYVVTQVKDEIKDDNPRSVNTYLEKIFQVRIYMPSNSGFNYLKLIESIEGFRINNVAYIILRDLFDSLTYRDTILIRNGIKIFNKSIENKDDYDFTAKVLLQIIALRYQDVYDFMAYNYEKILTEKVKKKLFPLSSIKPPNPPQVSSEDIKKEEIKIKDFDDNSVALIICTLYFMTPYNASNLEKSIYFSYFKFKTPEYSINRSALYKAIDEMDQNFIDIHLGTEKEENLIINLEYEAINFKKLGKAQVDFIIKNLIKHLVKLMESGNFWRIFESNLYEFPHKTIMANYEVYYHTGKKFASYLNEYNKDTNFKLIAKFWYLEDDSFSFLENKFREYLNDNHDEIGHIFKLLYLKIWPENFVLLYNDFPILQFRELLKELYLNNIKVDPIKYIKPFIHEKNGEFTLIVFYNNVDTIKNSFNLVHKKQRALHKWVSKYQFIKNGNEPEFYPLDYKFIFEEEYNSFFGSFDIKNKV
jgi:hypothetical protein